MKLNARGKSAAPVFKIPSWREVVRKFSLTRSGPLAAPDSLDPLAAKKSSAPEYVRAKPTRRPAYALEPVEPRLLMSADLSYAGIGGAGLTLHAVSPNVLNIVDTNNSSIVATYTLATSGAQTITIQDTNASDTGGDVLHVNLDTLSALDSTIGSGGTLTLQFTSANQAKDQIVLDGTNANNATPADTIHYGLALTSDAQINSSGAATVAGSLTIESSYSLSNGIAGTGLLANDNTGIALTGASFTTTGAGNNITLESTSTLNVANDGSYFGAITSATSLDSAAQNVLNNNLGSVAAKAGVSVITSYSSAAISITGGTVLNAAGDLDIASMVDGSLSGSAAKNPLGVNIAVVAGGADPSVLIGGSGTDLTAGGAINVTATTADSSNTPFTISNIALPPISHINPSTSVDGAVAVTVFDSQATVSVSGSADINAAGATSLIANSALDAATTGDASGGSSAGAGVAVAAVYGDTTASVDASTVDGGSITLAADSTRTITTTAIASTSGSSASGDNSNPSENTLSNNNASASDGAGGASPVSVAGAVAVTTDTGTDQAYINNGAISAGSGGVAVSATPTDVVATTADGSQTGSNGSQGAGVGVGVAINIVDRNNQAYLGGATAITAGPITVQVLATTPSSFSAVATSGFGSSDVGIAGSLAINVVVDNDNAYVANGATLTLTGSPDLTIEADSNITHIATAIPSSGGGDAGSVGVGASIAINYGENATAAYVDNSAAVAGANNLTMTASSQQAMYTTAQNGAASGGGVAVTPVIAISVADNNVYAKLGTGAGVTIGGAFKAQSSLTDSLQTTATGNTKASNVGVGVSIAISIVNDSSQATTGQNLIAGGAAAFLSTIISGSESNASASSAGDSSGDGNSSGDGVDSQTSNQKSVADSTAKTDESKVGNTKTKGAGNDTSPKAQSSGGSVNVAGAVAVNIENGSSTADIPDGITVHAGGLVTAQSQANVDGHAISSGAATTTGNGVSVGVGVSVNVNNPTNLAYVGQGANVTGAGLAVSATMADRAVAAPTTEPVVTIDSNTTNTFYYTDTIFVGPSSGLETGDLVQYLVIGGDPIGGLKNGGFYYVNAIGDGTVKLYGNGDGLAGKADAQAGDPNFVKLTSIGAGGLQELVKYKSLGVPDTSFAPVGFNPAADTQRPIVTLDKTTDIVSPQDSVFPADSIFVGLHPSAEVAAPFLGLGAGLKSGDKVLVGPTPGSTTVIVTFDPAINAPGVLVGDFYVSVGGDGTLRFYSNQADALAGNDKFLKFLALTGSGPLTIAKYVTVNGAPVPDLVPGDQIVISDPTATATLLDLGPLSSFRTGDAVTYDAGGGTSIAGLDGSGQTTYYLIDLTNGRYQLAASREDAFLGKQIDISGAGNANQVVHDDTNSSLATAQSGASGGTIGVDGSLAINLVNNDTQALVGLTPGETGASTASITITGVGNVSVNAAGAQTNYALATPASGEADGSKLGVGASVAVNVIGATQNLVNAEIANGASFTGSIGALTVSATGADGGFTHGENGASGGGVTIGVGAAVAVFNDTVEAYVGAGNGLSATGDVNITASLNADLKTETSGETAGGKVGVGASVSVAVLSENASAVLARSIATTGGLFNLTSTSTLLTDAKATATVKGEDSSGGDGSGGGQSSADGQASKEQGSATAAGAKSTTLPSAGGAAGGGQGKSTAAGGETSSGGSSGKGGGDSSGVGVAAAVAVNVLTANNTAEITGGADVSASGAVTIAA